jgi:diguanylate cyclase (GGDEF)-like protein
MAKSLTLEKTLGALILLTLIAIVAERQILETSIVLNTQVKSMSAYDDRGEQGASVVRMVDPAKMEWQCNIQAGHRYPYCGFELIFDTNRTHGLDLRNYDHIRLWLTYEGPTESIRVYLRNFDPVYSDPEKNDSTKFNQIDFDAQLARTGKPIDFSMTDFFVANWWFQRYRVTPQLAHPQFDNIVVFEIQTGLNAKQGKHTFHLQKIELTGQLLSSERWYQIIVAVWLVIALVFLAVRIVLLNLELKNKAERERELTETNQLLDSRSRYLEVLARTDTLTGACNRQGLEDAMVYGLNEWRQEGKPLSIVMLDIDYFKSINDAHGHAVGDKVLSRIAMLVQDNIRTSDLFARWGGEEFVVVCRNTRLQAASLIAEKLRAIIAEESFDVAGSVHASFGVATLRTDETLEQIFARVDSALYDAKHRGRNRVEISPAVA